MSAPVALARLLRMMPDSVAEVLRTLSARGQAVVVGGAVRNAFLGLAIPDWDLATSLPPTEVAGMFARVSRAGEKHGTIMVLTAGGPVEVTTFRGEGAYFDGRRPSSVVFLTDVTADLARRDFTINAMAADANAQRILDPFGGAQDLRRRLVQTVGDPAARFGEDGLRPLRAVRFAAVLGFRLARATDAALAAALPTFVKVAWERKRDEMERLLAGAARTWPAMRMLGRSGMLRELAPGLAAKPRLAGRLDRLGQGVPWLRLTAWALASGMSPSQLGALFERWRIAASARDAAVAQARALLALPALPPKGAALRRWASGSGPEHAKVAALLAQALLGPGYRRFSVQVNAMIESRAPLSVRDLRVSGDDLLRLGFEGKAVGDTLRDLLAAVLSDPTTNERHALLHLAHRLSTTHRVKT